MILLLGHWGSISLYSNVILLTSSIVSVMVVFVFVLYFNYLMVEPYIFPMYSLLTHTDVFLIIRILAVVLALPLQKAKTSMIKGIDYVENRYWRSWSARNVVAYLSIYSIATAMIGRC